MTFKIKRSAHQLRKTEHKMSDLSVTGSNVSSGYKTRSQMARSATQPAQQRPQRRYNSALHKVCLLQSNQKEKFIFIVQNNASTGVAKQTIGGGHSQQYGTVSAQWLREHA